MSNLFYHKDLTDAQWNKIKFVFEGTKRVDARRLITESFSTPSCGYSKAERVGAIYLPVTVIGTVFTTSSAFGAPLVCLSDC